MNATVEVVVESVGGMTSTVEVVVGSVGSVVALTVLADIVDADELEVIVAGTDTGATEVLDPHAARTSAPQIDDRTASRCDRMRNRPGVTDD